MNAQPKRFYKSATDSMLFGVAGGISEYFDADPTLVRLAWVLAGIASEGLALIVYIVLAIIMPRQSYHAPAPAVSHGGEIEVEDSEAGESDSEESSPSQTMRRTGRLSMFGIILIVIGALLLLSNLGLLHWWRWDIALPVILILAGLVILAGRLTRRQNG